MTPAEEDALVWRCYHDSGHIWRKDEPYPNLDPIRLAIRAAYAQGKEDAAKVCEDGMIPVEFNDYQHGINKGREDCAAAIRRGEC